MKLTVATYNICHGVDYRNAPDKEKAETVNLPLTGAVIRDLQADLAGLNEVYSIGAPDMTDQTGKLAALAGYKHSVFARGTVFGWGMDIGNAVLSRFPVLSSEAVAVPAPVGDERRPGENEWYEDRVILVTKVDLGTPVRFISTHFGLNLQERERMRDALVRVLDADDCPTILLGDFNSLPDDPVLAPLFARLTSGSDVCGKRHAPTFSAWDPHLAIDYIFFSRHFALEEYEIVPVIASDHMPVRAVLNFTPEAAK